ncbi:MAPEG family protein [Sandarakinorhabdus sp. DWP1-3-1]|uniref:MAPEG family protein n=1 Tax=Sandarakinorhabdus sp. DWP1-3-1 TaxID=2804627 RepID=UPI003CF396DB
MALYPLTALAILLALAVYFGLGAVVGAARAKYDVPAPQSSGHPEFDKRNRVHVNTLEQLVLFVPAAMLAAPVLGDAVAGGLGLIWTVGRFAYARAYYVDPKTRSLGFLLTILPTFILFLAAAWGAIRTLLA